MATYSYTATNKQGKSIKGKIDATDKSAATNTLVKEGLKPIVVKEAKGGFDPNNLQFSWLKSKKVKTKDLVIFTRQLSTMINAGVPLVRALATLQAQTESDPLREALEIVTRDVESGLALADSLSKHPKIFSDVYTNMVAAGEAGGILDDILKKLALQQEKTQTMKKKVKSASTYPVILLVITVGAFFGLMLFVIPKIGKILTDLGGEDAELPALTQTMIGVSDFMIANFIFVLIAMIAAIYGVRRYIKTDKGRLQWHTLLLKIPVLNKLIVKIAIARFSRTFASLMSSGVGVLDALAVTGNAMGNVVIKNDLKKAMDDVKNGRQLSEPLSESKIFPPIVAQMLAVGEETGQVDTILVKVADFYEEEVDTLIDGLASIIEPIMIVIMGGMVGLIAYSVMGPIASLSQNIGA